MPKTYYLDDNFINVALRGIAFTPPAQIYVSLYTVAPSVSGGGTEVAGGSYARQLVTFVAPVNGQSSNTAEILFPVASADWGTIVAFALMDASSGGNMQYFGNLSTPRLIQTSDQVRFPASSLVVIES